MGRGGVGCDCAPRVGCDLTEVEAVRTSIATFGERYLGRIYSADERRQTGEAPERLAARFAAKEAVLKLLGVDALSVVDVEILSAPSGAPYVRLSDGALASAGVQGIGEIAVSLSHEGGMAMATAFALTRPRAWNDGTAPHTSNSNDPGGNK
jgi:holo-[acyl-carrier protein] synthase